MTDTPLQKPDYRNSPYLRPNANWVCGRLQDGKPCAKGPDKNGNCHTRTECMPNKEGDRWACARSPLAGGPCESGPLPDGSCCLTVTRCSPVRSWRAKRGFFSKWVFATCIGIAVLMLSGSDMPEFVNPGKLSTKHADLDDCQTCHSPFQQGLTHWVKTALALDSGVDDSRLCLSCHVLEENPQLPHNLSVAKLQQLSDSAATAGDSRSVPLQLASWLYPERQQQAESLTCATCHREHHADDSRLTELSNEQCLICHQAKFDNFSQGHPEFNDFPYARRTKLNFDHVAHINKHFQEEEYAGLTTGSCTQCHEPDAKGQKMLVKSFQGSCSSCHNSQILGETRSGSKGIPVFAVPGLDTTTLKERGIVIGDWPEFADESLSPFTELLLSSDKKFVKANARLNKIDLLDLSDASEEQLASVGELAWSMKRLLYDLLQHGTAELKRRLESSGGQLPATIETRSLIAMLPQDAVRMTQESWFPRLQEEMPLFQKGDMTALRSMPDLSPAVNTRQAGAIATPAIEEDSGDDLFDEELGDDEDLFGDDGDDGDLFAEEDDDEDLFGEEEDSDKGPVQLSADDWAAFGGWFRDEFALRYAPTGHADTFLKNWLDYLAANKGMAQRRLFRSLTAGKAIGACNKCHSVDKLDDQVFVVNWRAIGTTADPHSFTRYSHTTHFNLTDDRGCVQCHVMDKDADYAGSFSHHDAKNFSSNFKPMERQFCADCHQQELAGDSCLQCHNYHITEILSELMANGSQTTNTDLD